MGRTIAAETADTRVLTPPLVGPLMLLTESGTSTV